MKIKTILLFSFLILTSTTSIAQLSADEFYKDKSNFIIYEQVFDFDSLTSDEIINKIKNWGATKFVDLNRVLVGDTKDQLVFSYINEDFFVTTLGSTNYYDWHYRMVIKIKDNKIKATIYDDGNAYWGAKYAGNVLIPSTPARSYKYLDYFVKKGLCKKATYEGLKNVRYKAELTIRNLYLSLKEDESQEDW